MIENYSEAQKNNNLLLKKRTKSDSIKFQINNTRLVILKNQNSLHNYILDDLIKLEKLCSKNDLLLKECYLEKSRFFYFSKSYDSSYFYCKKILANLAKETYYLYSEANHICGLCNQIIGSEDTEAKKYFLNAFYSKFAKENRLARLKYQNSLALLLDNSDECNRKFQYLWEIINDQEVYPSLKISALANLSLEHSKSNNLDSGFYYIDKAINLSLQNKIEKKGLYGTKGNILLQKNRFQEAFEAYEKDYIEIKNDSLNYFNIAVNRLNSALALSNLDKNAEALKLLDESYSLSLKNKNYRFRQFVLRKIAYINYKIENYKLAYEAIAKVSSLKDSIFNNTAKKDVEELSIKYKTAQKELENEIIKTQKLTLENNNSLLFNENLLKEKENLQLIFEKEKNLFELNQEKLEKKHKESENVLLKKEQSLQKAKISAQNKILIGGGIGLGIITLLSLLLYRLSHKRKLMNETLLKQKDKIQLLNRELNHRVKNNLAFMTSLLEMQGRRTESEETRQALIESETRLKALALVHSQLFKSEADTEVNLKDYLDEIKQHLLGIFSIPDKKLNINTDFCDYTINAEDAMRLGLIVNESITNSVKHAFADVENPEIKISTSINKDGKLALYYSDNGPGILTTLKDNESSLGTKLIELLKKQLGDRYVFVV